MKSLDDRLLDAHARSAQAELVDLYIEAAQKSATTDARCFYLTHAYIFALELGLSTATDVRNELEHLGRI